LSMTASYENDGFRGSDFRVFANLVMRFSPELRGRASYDSRRERASAGVQYISRNRGVGAWTADAQIEHSVNRDMTLSGTAGYTANRFEVSAQRAQALNITGGDDGRETQTRLLVGSSLAFAGGRMALGRPIRDSFAIVGRHATLNDHDVYVDVDRGRRDYAARADEFGPALLPSLAAYSTRRIEYDVEDLPSGYNLGDGLFVVRSTYRSGLSLSVGTDLVASAVGRLVAADETPIAYAVGKVHSLDDDDFAPLDIFTNRVGRFGIQGLRPGDRYRVVLTSPRPTEFEIEVPADTQGLYDMKQVRISGDDPWQ
jgi:outer membrane usher protein